MLPPVNPVYFQTRLAGTMDVGRIRVEIPEGLPPAWADPDRLERILTNLLSNALKYSAPGTPVTVGVVQRDGEIVTSVCDQGPGIAPEQLPRLFQRYYRTEAGGERQEGLGLYITKRLVEAHGGRIWVRSQVGWEASSRLVYLSHSRRVSRHGAWPASPKGQYLLVQPADRPVDAGCRAVLRPGGPSSLQAIASRRASHIASPGTKSSTNTHTTTMMSRIVQKTAQPGRGQSR